MTDCVPCSKCEGCTCNKKKTNIPKCLQCVYLGLLPSDTWTQLQKEEFTVQRSNMKEESGWRIQQAAHSDNCGPGYNTSIGATDSVELGDAVALKKSPKGQPEKTFWHVFLNDGNNPHPLSVLHTHMCGWRPLGTFWPSRCKTAEEKQAWFTMFEALLESLPIWSKVLEERARFVSVIEV